MKTFIAFLIFAEEESIFKKTSLNNDDDYGNNEDENNRVQSSPYEWISNLVPFGHPNLGGGRHILSIDETKRRRRHIGEKKTVANSVQKNVVIDTFRILNVTETLFYATLNHTDPQLIELYSQDILQKCDLAANKKTFSCSPHYNTHANASK